MHKIGQVLYTHRLSYVIGSNVDPTDMEIAKLGKPHTRIFYCIIGANVDPTAKEEFKPGKSHTRIFCYVH